jgi:hypothetical protein
VESGKGRRHMRLPIYADIGFGILAISEGGMLARIEPFSTLVSAFRPRVLRHVCVRAARDLARADASHRAIIHAL